MKHTQQENDKGITVLELRNYLLKPNKLNDFEEYFNNHFVTPMAKLEGFTLGQFKINNVNDRFVWLRGFTDMKTRVNFLNDFYINSPTWKNFGQGANAMMLNSDHVHLLKPLEKSTTLDFLDVNEGIVLVDFYICNSTLNKVIDLFNTTYIPFLKSLNISDLSLWVSEMQENDFPRLPVFQDKNLLVTITKYKDLAEYEKKQKLIAEMNIELKIALQELVTIHSNLVLEKI
ncbi:NIPSNAP family protein [Flavobacterium sp. ABG]|uniref:NIPSNAP family protein n=1 Tax=Flavobacterium sp. ABG TaxID=1423322 RepID=UPI00069A9BA4|nr:NIPSNAP family protein [Flavobacterium sp. ABG]